MTSPCKSTILVQKNGLNMEQRVKVFPYVIQEERPLSDLGAFAEHHRLQTFYHKGCTCVKCGLEGTRLILGRNVKDGSKHWDIYSDDLTPLTVDHILPKSFGGPDTLENYQPMCSPCNSRKGNGLKRSPIEVINDNHLKARELSKYKEGMQIEGMELWRMVYKGRNKRKKPQFLGVIDSIGINPHSDKLAAIVVSKKVSFYDLKGNTFVRPYGGETVPVREPSTDNPSTQSATIME